MTEKLKPVAWVCYSNGKICDATIDEAMARSWSTFGNTMVFPLVETRHLSAADIPEEVKREVIEAYLKNLG